jgi:predicted permease
MLIRSFMNLTRVDIGFARAELSTFGVVTPSPRYNPATRIDFYQRLVERVRALPGVQSVAVMSGLPPLRSVNANDTDFEHIPNVDRPEGPPQNVDFYQNVPVGYSGTMGIPVIEGRSFASVDVGGPYVAMVNETLARRYFTDRSPIGQRVKPGFRDDMPWFTIVGVLKDVKQRGVGERTGTEIYWLVDQLPKALNSAPASMNIVARSAVPFAQLAPGFRRTVADLDPTLPVIRLRSMEDVIDESVTRPRFLAMLLGIFAGLALALAAVGTYGVLAYLVSERRQEIGIRMALGADRGMILRVVLTRGLSLTLIGLAVGFAASVGLTRVMKTHPPIQARWPS